MGFGQPGDATAGTGPSGGGPSGAIDRYYNNGYGGYNPYTGYTPAGTPTTAQSSPTLNYPTPQEVHNSIYSLPYMQQQQNILGNMTNMDAFRSAVLPEVQGVMKGLGRSGLPSSSYADKTITDTMGSLYNKWQWNALSGYQNIGAQMPAMMQQWYAPYNTMMGVVGS